MIAFLLATGWVVCGILAWGFFTGHSAKRWPYFRNLEFINFVVAFSGPVGLVVTLTLGGCHSFRLIPLTKEESWAAHQKTWPNLDREDFERSY
jgi:hypothetical protein